MEARHEIDVVRGNLDDETSAELLAFWAERSQLSESQAESRLPQVVCVLRAPGGAVAGANSVYQEDLPLIANRRFWVYRSLLAPGTTTEDWEGMLLLCFDTLADAFEPGGPIGIVAPIADPQLPVLKPEAIWPRSQFNYAGFLADGRQARVRYFPEGRV